MPHPKVIEKIIPPPTPHFVGDGFFVHNFFPGTNISAERMSPFVLLDYNALSILPPSQSPKGVGVHPHRGFETVTIAFHGKIAHHDSAGNAGVIGEGEVQWMTAGAGVLHKEYHEENFSRTGGKFQMVQLWVNLPAKYKMTPPQYQAIGKDQINVTRFSKSGSTIEVIAGNYGGIQGPAKTFTPIELYVIKLATKDKIELDIPTSNLTAALIIEGDAIINENIVAKENHLVLFGNNGTSITFQAESPVTVLFLSGEPIPEPIVSYGPFVMNTRQEIMNAMEDFENGKFGTLS